jgi:uncharacterized lipoprotein YajG
MYDIGNINTEQGKITHPFTASPQETGIYQATN